MATTEADKPQKASGLWFSPEVVVLRAKTRVFRVFVSILKAKSSVFADMFTFPQPTSSELEMLDGAPVVDVYDDPDEMEAFLKAIFDADFFLPPLANPGYTPESRDIAGVLRLSYKYDVAFLRRRALQHLDVEYPTRMVDLIPHKESTMEGAFLAIIAAIEVGAFWILPAAFYQLCVKWHLREITTSSAWCELEEDRKIACIFGYTALTEHAPRMVRSLLVCSGEGSTNCDGEDRFACNEMRIDYASDLLASLSRDCVNFLPKQFWHDVDRRATGLCDGCIGDLKSRYQGAQEMFWEALPGIFELPPWTELETMRRSALAE